MCSKKIPRRSSAAVALCVKSEPALRLETHSATRAWSRRESAAEMSAWVEIGVCEAEARLAEAARASQQAIAVGWRQWR